MCYHYYEECHHGPQNFLENTHQLLKSKIVSPHLKILVIANRLFFIFFFKCFFQLYHICFHFYLVLIFLNFFRLIDFSFIFSYVCSCSPLKTMQKRLMRKIKIIIAPSLIKKNLRLEVRYLQSLILFIFLLLFLHVNVMDFKF